MSNAYQKFVTIASTLTVSNCFGNIVEEGKSRGLGSRVPKLTGSKMHGTYRYKKAFANQGARKGQSAAVDTLR